MNAFSFASRIFIAKDICEYKFLFNHHKRFKFTCESACLSVNGQSTSLGNDGTGVEVIDLTPLISTNKNYQAEIDAATSSEHRLPNSIKFFLNVCRPLVPKYGLGCPGGSAACMAKMDKVTGKPEEEQEMKFKDRSGLQCRICPLLQDTVENKENPLGGIYYK
uniref:Uncharacterized protein n=1 Tax=Glossina austeni TaxID=7395 RepID=A0A1A9VUT6_GLOAU